VYEGEKETARKRQRLIQTRKEIFFFAKERGDERKGEHEREIHRKRN